MGKPPEGFRRNSERRSVLDGIGRGLRRGDARRQRLHCVRFHDRAGRQHRRGPGGNRDLYDQPRVAGAVEHRHSIRSANLCFDAERRADGDVDAAHRGSGGPMKRTLPLHRGFTLTELMVALTVSLLLLLALTVVFVGNSRSFSENERSSRQIENGRYALSLMSDGIRHAGFYGDVGDVTNLVLTPAITLPAALPDPCVTDVASVRAALALPLQGVDAPGAVPSCLPDHVAGTDVVVIRRANTTTVPAASAVAKG